MIHKDGMEDLKITLFKTVYAWRLKHTCSGLYNEILGYVTILK